MGRQLVAPHLRVGAGTNPGTSREVAKSRRTVIEGDRNLERTGCGGGCDRVRRPETVPSGRFDHRPAFQRRYSDVAYVNGCPSGTIEIRHPWRGKGAVCRRREGENRELTRIDAIARRIGREPEGLTRSHEAESQPLRANTAAPSTTSFGFHTASRLNRVSAGSHSNSDPYLANSRLMGHIRLRQNTTGRMVNDTLN